MWSTTQLYPALTPTQSIFFSIVHELRMCGRVCFPVLTSALPVPFIYRGVRQHWGEGDIFGSALSTWGAPVSWELNAALFICGTSVAHRQNY